MAVAVGEYKKVLLPDQVLPERYDVRLTPDLERFVFDGHVRIGVNVHESTAEVQLHSKELQVISASFRADGGAAEIEAVEVNLNLRQTVVALVFGEVLPVGRGTLTISYTGILNNQMAGFYRSQYKDAQGNTKYMASTQFEAIDARRCFPCWDEPARKAVFGLTLVVEPHLTAFSNMPEKSFRSVQVNGRHRREIVFMDSPKMSTYLLAMVVGEFDFVQASTENGVLVRVYTPPNRSDAGHFALEAAVKCLPLYDDFFGVPYPLPKLDMVAIPEFAAGAMENWGLVTYREVDLLIDPKTASNQQKQRVCVVVAHELAHQWFGNLVTMAWWDDLWLNEGFAAWCENLGTDHVAPTYGMWDQFPSGKLAHALRLDALQTSHPIQVPIPRAEDVEEVFDAISYCKGASVIRMAHAVLGPEAFRTGLQAYMKQHAYGNTQTTDLWNAWSASSGLDVRKLMSSWTEKMGFPLVEVKSFKMSGTSAVLELEQNWFLSSGQAPPKEQLWTIPLFIATGAQEGSKPTMMEGKSTQVTVEVGAGEVFVLVNAGVKTPMRVAYTPEMRDLLCKAIRAGKVPPADRSGLVSDAFCLAQAGKLGLDEMLRFLAAFAGERNYVVWEALQAALLGINKVLMGGAPKAVHEQFRGFASRFVQLGWAAAACGWEAKDSDGHTDGLLRGLLMGLMSRFAASAGDGGWLREARARFQRYVEDPVANACELPDEYRIPVLQAVLSHGGREEYAQLKAAYGKLTTNVDMKHIQQAIGWTPDSALKKEVLEWSISGEIKIQDFFYLMMGVSGSSREGLDLMWDFFQSEFQTIHGMVKGAMPAIMAAVITCAVSGFCSNSRADEVEAFFAKHPLPSAVRRISQLMEEVRTSASFVERALATKVQGDASFWEELVTSLGK